MADRQPAPYLFVLHPQRCGSTLLQIMLTRHPAISVAPESMSLQKLLRRFPTTGPLTTEQVAVVQRLVDNDAKLKAWKLDVTPYLETVRGYTAGITLRQIIDDQLRFYRDQVSPNAQVIGYKKGNMAEQAELLHALMPEARFIFIYRDARAAAASMIKNLRGYDALRAARKWRQRVWLARHFKRQHPGALLEVRYETLVESPVETTQAICAFIGAPYRDDILEYYQDNVQGEMIIGGKETIHRHTSEPISTRHMDKWKAQLSEHDVAIIEAITGDDMQRYGYSLLRPVLPAKSRLRCIAARWQDTRAMQKRLRWYRQGIK
ncbi:MAG: sulfotransferase [Anaerolineae bacterium]|nr:sulfotransferase [Anaerolineae bacterium]